MSSTPDRHPPDDALCRSLWRRLVDGPEARASARSSHAQIRTRDAVAQSFRALHTSFAMGRPNEDTLQLIVRWKGGEADARDRLIEVLHPALSQIAAARLRREQGTSLSSGDLINDAVLRLIRIEGLDINGRAHMIALASRLMRNILTDHARARRASKRDHHRVELTTRLDGEQRIDLAELESALIRLGAIDAQLMEIVEMRYFGGMTLADIAEVMGMSEPTVKRRWQAARAWLADTLANPLPS